MTTTPVITATTGTVTSSDGATIAYTRQGSGPAIVVVHCVAVDRTTTPQPTLPEALAEHFTVISYDRRGTGESTTIEPYAVEREIDDLRAVVGLVEGPVTAYGFSSGGHLALLAAKAGVPIDRLALLEPPLMPEPWTAERDRLRELVATDVAAAREYYLTEVVGVPAEILADLPCSEQDLANAPTMTHEMEFLPGHGAEHFAGLETPTLLIRSDHTVPEMAQWAQELTDVMPHARAVEVPGEWHGVDDATLVATIREMAP